MATDPRFDIFPEQFNEPERKRSKWVTCLIGCLIILSVLFILIVFAGWWVANNWRGWVADVGTQFVNQSIDESGLAEREKDEVKVQVKRVADALRENRISGEQANKFVDLLSKSPLMPMLVVVGIDKQYIAKSGLSEDEKREGRVSLERFTRGMIDKKIDNQGFDAVMSHVADRDPDGDDWKMRQKVSDADLRAALTEAKARADAANIPAEAEAVDPSDEFKRIIDEALREGARDRIQGTGKAESPKAEEPKAIEKDDEPATDADPPKTDEPSTEPPTTDSGT